MYYNIIIRNNNKNNNKRYNNPQLIHNCKKNKYFLLDNYVSSDEPLLFINANEWDPDKYCK